MKKKDICLENPSKLFEFLSDKDSEKLSGGKGNGKPKKKLTVKRSLGRVTDLGYGELW